MDAVKDFLDNEKGVFALAILVCATVLVALDKLPIDQWTSLAKWIFGFYALGTAAFKSAVAFTSSRKTSQPVPPAQ